MYVCLGGARAHKVRAFYASRVKKGRVRACNNSCFQTVQKKRPILKLDHGSWGMLIPSLELIVDDTYVLGVQGTYKPVESLAAYAGAQTYCLWEMWQVVAGRHVSLYLLRDVLPL